MISMMMTQRQDTMRVASVFVIFSVLILSVKGRPLDHSASLNSTDVWNDDDPFKPKTSADEEKGIAGTVGGDMKLSPDQIAVLLSSNGLGDDNDDDGREVRVKRKVISDPVKRWPLNTVPYVLQESTVPAAEVASWSTVIRSAMVHWEENTCLKFVPYSQETGNQLGHQQHISFTYGSGCWSYLGKKTTTSEGQALSIGPKCATFGTVIHEIGHSVGFVHEHSRPDRDDHVTVHKTNVQPDVVDNFNKWPESLVNTSYTPYDVKSVMHYSRYSFAIDKSLPTITTVNPLYIRYLGQRKGLSFRDAKSANIMYNCDSSCASNSLSCSNEGYIGPGCTCVCPEEFTGPDCSDANPDYIPPCEHVLTSDSGYIESLNFGIENYPPSFFCMYHIKPANAASNMAITLTFDAFSLESSTNCDWDYVRVFNDQLTSGGQVFCGSTLPEPVTSIGQEMVVWFRSDIYVTMPGFRANYSIEAVPPVTSSRPTEPPVITTKPTTEPPITTKPATTTKPTTEPPVTTKPATTTKPTTEPATTTKPTTEPATTTKPTTKPATTTKPTTEPATTTKPTTRPVVTTTPTTKPTTEPVVTTKPTTKTTTELTVTTKLTTKPITKPVTTTAPTTAPSPEPNKCQLSYTSNSGDLHSPNYPKKYPNNYRCNYTITVPAGQRVVLEFTTIKVESSDEDSIVSGSVTCPYDYILVHLGQGIHTPMRLCGNKPPEASLVSLSNTMTLEFITDGSVTKRGFSASYHAINGSLPEGRILDVGQSVTYDKWPKVCPGRLQKTCIYSLEVPDDQRVELVFQSMGMTESDSCKADSMEVDIGDGIAVPMAMCGNGLPQGSIISLSNTLDLKCTTADDGTSPTFSALYRAVPQTLFDLPDTSNGADGNIKDVKSGSNSDERDSGSNSNGDSESGSNSEESDSGSNSNGGSESGSNSEESDSGSNSNGDSESGSNSEENDSGSNSNGEGNGNGNGNGNRNGRGNGNGNNE